MRGRLPGFMAEKSVQWQTERLEPDCQSDWLTGWLTDYVADRPTELTDEQANGSTKLRRETSFQIWTFKAQKSETQVHQVWACAAGNVMKRLQHKTHFPHCVTFKHHHPRDRILCAAASPVFWPIRSDDRFPRCASQVQCFDRPPSDHPTTKLQNTALQAINRGDSHLKASPLFPLTSATFHDQLIQGDPFLEVSERNILGMVFSVSDPFNSAQIPRCQHATYIQKTTLSESVTSRLP